MSRTGKIARLPRAIREELNHRLDDGQAGPEIIAWLNGLKECKAMLSERFEGRPINEQNLSDWKQGGYEDWRRQEETIERVSLLLERGDDVDETTGGNELADRIGSVVAVELAQAVQDLRTIADGKERWRRLQEISTELARLRRGDHHAKRLLWEKELNDYELEMQHLEERKKEAKEKM